MRCAATPCTEDERKVCHPSLAVIRVGLSLALLLPCGTCWWHDRGSLVMWRGSGWGVMGWRWSIAGRPRSVAWSAAQRPLCAPCSTLWGLRERSWPTRGGRTRATRQPRGSGRRDEAALHRSSTRPTTRTSPSPAATTDGGPRGIEDLAWSAPQRAPRGGRGGRRPPRRSFHRRARSVWRSVSGVRVLLRYVGCPGRSRRAEARYRRWRTAVILPVRLSLQRRARLRRRARGQPIRRPCKRSTPP